MNNGSKERNAVNRLKDYLDSSEYFNTDDIKVGDKGEIWDGFIGIYEEPGKAKGFKRLPIQVKGTQNIKNDSFTVGKNYIEGFASEGIGLFFVVDVTYSKIYYKLFEMVEMKRYLNKKNICSYSVKFTKIPADINEFLSYCRIWIKYREDIINTRALKVDDELKNAKELRLTTQASNQTIFSILNKPAYITATYADGTKEISQLVNLKALVESNTINFVYDGQTFFVRIDVSKNEFQKIIQIRIGDSITLSFENDSSKITVNDNTNVLSSKIDNCYLMYLIENNHFALSSEMAVFKERLRRNIEALTIIEKVCCKIRLDVSKIFISKLTEKERKFFDMLNNIKSVSESSCGLHIITIQNQSGAIIVYKSEDGTLSYDSVYSGKSKIWVAFPLTGSEEMVFWGKLAVVFNKYEDLISITNFDDVMFIDALKEAEFKSEEIRENIETSIMLDLVKAFDKKKTPNYLSAAKGIIGLLQNNEYTLINQMQIFKRERALNTDEKIKLLEIKKCVDSTIEIKWAISILLDYKEEAVLYYRDIEDKNTWMNYPIYQLYLALIAE